MRRSDSAKLFVNEDEKSFARTAGERSWWASPSSPFAAFAEHFSDPCDRVLIDAAACPAREGRGLGPERFGAEKWPHVTNLVDHFLSRGLGWSTGESGATTSPLSLMGNRLACSVRRP